MIEAKQEILNTLQRLIQENDKLKEVDWSHIEEIVDYLDKAQFKPHPSKLKAFIEKKVEEISVELVREDKRRGA